MVAHEDSYVLTLPSNFIIQSKKFLTACSHAIGKFEISIDEAHKVTATTLNISISKVEATLKEIETTLETIFNWVFLLNENKRSTISGAEYWALVANLTKVINMLSLRSDFTQNKVSLYGDIYQDNISYLQQLFREHYFGGTRDSMIAPLYEELKRCRLQELSLPKYNF